MGVMVYEFKSVSVTVKVFRFDVRITIRRRSEDPLVMVVSQKLCGDPNNLVNELEVDTYLDGVG
jgi:hypothetical protein